MPCLDQLIGKHEHVLDRRGDGIQPGLACLAISLTSSTPSLLASTTVR
jgi:hypothetical protein